MYSAEVLSQLRQLNWLGLEVRHLPAGSPGRAMLDAQLDAIRARLPISILQYHDERSRHHLPSVATLRGSSCGHCGVALPGETIQELSRPGCFGVCPGCGVFLCSSDAPEAGAESTASARASHETKKTKSSP